MTSLLALIVLGFLLGMRHATDPDHVIAVTTIVARQKTPGGAAVIGAAWGVGHTLTILLVGGGIILFDWVIPPRIGLSMDFSVGLMLIVLGIANLLPAYKRIRASRPLEGTYQLARPLVVGIVHGLAGSAAVALLVLATIREPAWAVGYLAIFGLGTIAGMMVMTALIILPFAHDNRRFTRLNGGLRVASGLISVAFGAFVAYRTGIVHGLFTGTPWWTPQ